MNKFTRKILHLFTSKKKAVFLVFILALAGIFLIGQLAYAVDVLGIGNVIANIPMIILALCLMIFASLSALLAGLGSTILLWITSGSFMPWAYTNNPIVSLGLEITRPLANMILVLVLVFIAMATILRLAGYETKKLLPTFILIALLVNFSPVFCGLIVDASNIVMNFFVKGIAAGKNLTDLISTIGDYLTGYSWTKFNLKENITRVLSIVVFIAVNLSLFFILLLFAFIFMLRHIVIWLLVILSPLAFVSFILPATRGFWNQWWKQFVQWSVIGITMGFFLYLADQYASLSNVVHDVSGAGTMILPLFVPVAFLYLGFMFAIQTGAMGATAIMNFAQKTESKWRGRAAGAVKRRIISKGQDLLSSEKVQSAAQKMATAETPGKHWYSKAAFAAPWAAARKLGKAVGPGMIERRRGKIGEYEKKFSGLTTANQMAAFRGATTNEEQVAALNAMVKDRNVDEAMENFGLSMEEVTKTRLNAGKYGMEKDILAAMPSIDEDILRSKAGLPSVSDKPTNQLSKTQMAQLAKQYEEITKKIRPNRIGQLAKSELDNEAFMQALVHTADGRHMQELSQAQGMQAINKINETVKKNLKTVNQKNPALLQYARNSAGQRIGLNFEGFEQ